jgi:hypothetical protein
MLIRHDMIRYEKIRWGQIYKKAMIWYDMIKWCYKIYEQIKHMIRWDQMRLDMKKCDKIWPDKIPSDKTM